MGRSRGGTHLWTSTPVGLNPPPRGPEPNKQHKMDSNSCCQQRRADGMVIKGAEELVELLMVGPAEMVLGGGRRASRIAQLNYLDAKRIPQQPRTSRSRCQSER